MVDFFCGSGTFPLVATRHERSFLAGDVSWRALHTTRKRLIETSRTPFPLYRKSAAAIPLNVLTCPLIVANQIISLKDPPAFDYWEIDPAWDEKIFRSAVQAQRSNRSAEIPQELKCPLREPLSASGPSKVTGH